jgi:uncharacterized protein with FMN-binding domain
MRRITLAIVSTVAVLVLLFSYRTSLGDPGPGGATAQAASEARVLTSGPPATTAATAGSSAGAGDDPNQITTPDNSSSTTSTSTPDPQAATGSTPSTATPPTGRATTPTAGTQTVQGAEEMTRYGAVQVDVTISGGVITEVQAVQYPYRERLDQEINDAAIPELRNQVLSAQSADVAGVSGATYTTQGYLASVQSALDAAGFTR